MKPLLLQLQVVKYAAVCRTKESELRVFRTLCQRFACGGMYLIISSASSLAMSFKTGLMNM